MNIDEIRANFENLKDIKEMLKNNDELIWSEEQGRYVNHRVFQDAETGFINGAFYLYQIAIRKMYINEKGCLELPFGECL